MGNSPLELILHPLQNINKSWSTKVNVFGLNFELNTLSFFKSILLIFCNGMSIAIYPSLFIIKVEVKFKQNIYITFLYFLRTILLHG
jgi:hypothetical protein